jgi:hypothetical protein
MKRFATDPRSGQSIIEALIALSILMVGLMGVLALLSRSLSLQRVTSDNAKATYLAAEGVEVAKSLIDYNVYYGVAQNDETDGWNGALTDCFDFLPGGSNTYELDFMTTDCASLAPASIGAGQDGALCTSTDGNGVTNYYDCDDPEMPPGYRSTDFSRLVTIKRSSDGNSIDVVSRVTWSTGGFTDQNVTLEDTFYNWHP